MRVLTQKSLFGILVKSSKNNFFINKKQILFMQEIKSFKDLPDENLVTGGHSLCAGCCSSIGLRLALLALGKNTIIINSSGCLTLQPTYPYNPFRVPWIHLAIETGGSGATGIYAALKVLKKDKDVNILAYIGDGSTYDIGLQSLSNALERNDNFIYVCYNNQNFANCLSTSSLIMTENGLKNITEVKPRDMIYAFDQKIHKLVLKKCTGVFNNGVREIFEVGTNHHVIKATSNHPFLVLKRNGRGRKNSFIWKTLAELRVGDGIVVLKSLNTVNPFKFSPIKESKVGDYKVIYINEITIPKISSSELMEYLGIYVGDGWTRAKRGEIGFALPEEKKARKRLLKLHSRVFSSKINVIDEVYLSIYSVNLVRFINSLGFGHGAKNKTIPSWIFMLPKDEKEAFVKGLLFSDGYKEGRSMKYVSSSFELLRRLRLLLQTMNYRAGKIHWRNIKKGTVCGKRRLLKDTWSGMLVFSRKRSWNVEKYPSQYRYTNFLIENEYFDVEKIKYIIPTGIEPTLDLRVKDEHNFISDGIVVHNTGVQMSSATPKFAWTTTTPLGNPFMRKPITKIVASHRIPYVATASVGFAIDYINKVKKAASIKGAKFIDLLTPCQPGWGIDSEKMVHVAKLGVETGAWPLYEITNGKFVLNYKPDKLKPVKEYLQLQRRFKHLKEKEIKEIQNLIDKQWELLVKGKFWEAEEY